MKSRPHIRLFWFVALILIAGMACSVPAISADTADQIDGIINQIWQVINSITVATPAYPGVTIPGTGNQPQAVELWDPHQQVWSPSQLVISRWAVPHQYVDCSDASF